VGQRLVRFPATSHYRSGRLIHERQRFVPKDFPETYLGAAGGYFAAHGCELQGELLNAIMVVHVNAFRLTPITDIRLPTGPSHYDTHKRLDAQWPAAVA
jgi:hypothetical protein